MAAYKQRSGVLAMQTVTTCLGDVLCLVAYDTESLTCVVRDTPDGKSYTISRFRLRIKESDLLHKLSLAAQEEEQKYAVELKALLDQRAVNTEIRRVVVQQDTHA